MLSSAACAALPDVPTAKEAGIETFEGPRGTAAPPAGTPRDIINRLDAEWVKIEADPDTKEKMQTAGFETVASTPEQFSEFIKQDIARWSKVVKEANLSVD